MTPHTYTYLLTLWAQTGHQDWANVGEPLQDAEDAGVTAADTSASATAKFKRLALTYAEASEASVVDDNLSPAEAASLTAAQRRGLLDAWAHGWASAAARDAVGGSSRPSRHR